MYTMSDDNSMLHCKSHVSPKIGEKTNWLYSIVVASPNWVKNIMLVDNLNLN